MSMQNPGFGGNASNTACHAVSKVGALQAFLCVKPPCNICQPALPTVPGRVRSRMVGLAFGPFDHGTAFSGALSDPTVPFQWSRNGFCLNRRLV